ncbi:hypothetical protein C8R47DRAFT_1215640 [Mycena vitilis]|nr:hypothetical protein C8R47DRAFT_1215640 [Mycena vitilis]
MPRAGTAKRRRERQGLGPVKPGKPSWVAGTKLGFFESMQDDYLAAAEIKETGPFYSRAADAFVKKYGYNMPWHEDLEEGQLVADDVDPDEDENSLTQAEGERRAKFNKALRGDVYQKIGVWFNSTYGCSVEKKKKKKVTFRAIFDKPELDPPQPRIKPLFTTRWAAASRLPNAPKPVTLRNKVTKEAWAAEPEELKQEVLAAREADDKAAREAYAIAVSGEVPATAEEYNVALNNAAYYLQPFADSAHERFGMNVVILMCGPVPERGGRIEVRSIHSGKSNGMVPRIWPEYDRAGFDATQRSFVDFSHHCFTEAECRARSLNGMAMAAENDSSVNPEDVSTSRSPTPTPAPAPTTSQSRASTPAASEAADGAKVAFMFGGGVNETDVEATSRRAAEDPDSLTLEGPSLDSILVMPDLFDIPQGYGGLGYDLNGDMANFGLPGDFNFGFGAEGLGLRNYEGLDEDANGLPCLNMRNRDDDEEEDDESDREEEPEREDKAVMDTGGGGVSDKPDEPGDKDTGGGGVADADPQKAPATSDTTLETATTAPSTASAAGEKGAEGAGNREEEAEEGAEVWRQETSGWSEELRNTFVGFARGKSWGGKDWEKVVTALISLEKASGFP